MSETGRHRGELAGLLVVLFVVKRADMQFVDDELVARREMKVVPLPVEARVVNDGVADRAGHFAGIRVNALELALRRGQQVAVLIPDMSLGNVGIPVAVLLGLHGMFAAIPVVERSDNGYLLCIRRPNAKPNSPWMRNGSHALDFRFTAHFWSLTTMELFPGWLFTEPCFKADFQIERLQVIHPSNPIL